MKPSERDALRLLRGLLNATATFGGHGMFDDPRFMAAFDAARALTGDNCEPLPLPPNVEPVAAPVVEPPSRPRVSSGGTPIVLNDEEVDLAWIGRVVAAMDPPEHDEPARALAACLVEIAALRERLDEREIQVLELRARVEDMAQELQGEK
jgi:hypothetical protein